jgi:ABC-type branched-subunit amino acid transport system ATPase component
MDSISSDNPALPRLGNNNPASGPISAGASSNAHKTQQENAVKSSFSNLPKLAEAANQLSPDIRQEAIERARALLEDPNWLSDESLEALSSKIIHLEKI